MSRISGRDTKPEILVRRYLRTKGCNFSTYQNLPGKPDLVFRPKKIIVFVNGCFWHKHKNCRNFVIPKTNRKFWIKKLGENEARDRRNYKVLKTDGWKVVIIWECLIEKNLNIACRNLIRVLNTLKPVRLG